MPILAIAQNRLDHELCFRVRIFHSDIGRFGAVSALRKQVLFVLPLAFGDQQVGGVENRLSRTIVLLQRDDLGSRHELIGKAKNIFDFSGAKRIDRLRVITNHCDAVTLWFEGTQNLRLNQVGVLVFIDQNMVEPGANLSGKFFFRDQVAPVQQQVVIVERLVVLFARNILAKQFAQF